MLLAVVAVGIGLFLYRELPDMVRKRVYNDPVPLVVTDKTKIQIRQVPYAPGGHFLYRLYLPRDHRFEICLAEAGETDTLPLPQEVHQLLPFPEGDGRGVEWRISGARFYIDQANGQERFDVKVERYDGFGSMLENPQSITFTRPKKYTTGAQIRRHGFGLTETLSPDEPVLLFREVWSDSPVPFMRDAFPPGPGIVVWIRPAPVQKKSPSR